MYFVWINGLRGPQAQLWIDDGIGKSKLALFKIKLTEGERTQSLDYLAMKYSKNATF